MRKYKLLAALISLSLLTGATSAFAASASDFQDKEYYASGGLDFINAANAYALGYTGKGITIGVSDAPQNFLNPEFNTKTASSMLNVETVEGYPTGTYPWDEIIHGTHVAGIAAASRNGLGMQGVAYDAEIAGSCSCASESATGVIFSQRMFKDYFNIASNKVINISWHPDYLYMDVSGYGKVQDFFTEDREYFGSQTKEATEADKLLAFAAGNKGHAGTQINGMVALFLPETAHNIICVTNVNQNYLQKTGTGGFAAGQLMQYASDLAKYAEDFTVAAPGVNIYSANANFAAAGEDVDVAMTGTSMSTPFVTGTVALVQEAFPYMSAKQLGDVVLSTANKNITSIVNYALQFSPSSQTEKMVVYYLNDGRVRTNQELVADAGEYGAEFADEVGFEMKALQSVVAARLKKGTFVAYYNVPVEALVGQGILDAGAAVKGPGALNVRRLTKNDISNDYTVAGAKGKQALYTINTAGYNSNWSNDIKEIKSDYIAADSSEEDLQARWLYYYTNWLSNSSDAIAQATTQKYVNVFNQNVDDSGLRNLHAGLYKTGAGILRLTGDNTYQGSTVAAGGTLAVDGSVAGDAYSTGSGILAGTGTVKGNVYNNGTLQPGTYAVNTVYDTNPAYKMGTLTINGNLNGTGKLAIAVQGTENSKLNVQGASTLTGSSLSVVPGYYPLINKQYNYLTSQGGIIGNVQPEAISPYLNLKATVNGNNGYFTAANTTAIGNQPGTTPSENSVGSALQNKAMGAITSDPTSANAQAMNDLFYQNTNTAGRFIKDVTSEARAALLNQSPMSSLTNETVYSRLDTVDFSGDLGITTQAASLDGNAPEVKTSLPVTLDSTNNVWFKLFRGFENYNYNDSLENKSFGGAIGYDHALNLSTRIGGLFSYGVTDYNTDNIEGKSHDWRLGVYGSKYNGDWEYQALATYGRNHYDIDRSTAWEGSKVNGDYKAKVWDGELKARYFIPSTRTRTWQVKPYGKVSYTHTNQDAYAETGSSIFKQSLNSASNNSWRGEVGIELNRNLTKQSSWGGSVGYKRVISGLNPELNGSFIGDTNGFAIKSDNDRNYVTYSLNARSALGGKWMGQVEFRGEASSNMHKEIFSVTAKYSF